MKRLRFPLFCLAAMITAALPSFGQTAGADPKTAANTSLWDTIKDYPYDKHAEFVAGLNRLAANLDSQIKALDAKRAGMTDSAAKDWDFAMSDLRDARADLSIKIDALAKASSEKWPDAKDKAATAWKRTQDDYDKVILSTTT